MSHVHNISTDGIKFDLEVIRCLCQRRGWQFIENQKTFKWYGRFVGDSPVPEGYSPDDYGKCEHAIRIAGCDYEVGLVRAPNGGWHVLADFWRSGGLDKVLGPQGEVFHEWYNMEKDIAWAEEQGYAWEEIETQELTKKLVVHAETGGDW